MDARLQRVGAWCGILTLILFALSFMLIAGLIPPTSPTASAEEVTDFLIDHKLRIRVGLALGMVFAALTIPFFAALCLRIRRAEGRWGMLTLSQLIAAPFVPIGFIVSMMILGAATFRPEQRLPDVNLALSDLFWLLFVGAPGTILVQAVVLATAAFIDRSVPRTFPRWFGYFNLWFVLLVAPSGAVVIFNDGPLAWNGVFAFWIPLAAFSTWMVTISVVLLRSISAEAEAEAPLAAAR